MIICVCFHDDLKSDAQLLDFEAEVAHWTVAEFSENINTRYKECDTLHLMAHGNWLQFDNYNPKTLAEFLLPFLTTNPQLKHLTIDSCYSGDRDPTVLGQDPQAFCKQFIGHIKAFLPEHAYLEVKGFTGRVFVGVDGKNHVWDIKRTDHPPNTAHLRRLEQALPFYAEHTKPEELSSILWRIKGYTDEIDSEPPTPTA